jgi:hypothetical protein
MPTQTFVQEILLCTNVLQGCKDSIVALPVSDMQNGVTDFAPLFLSLDARQVLHGTALADVLEMQVLRYFVQDDQRYAQVRLHFDKKQKTKTPAVFAFRYTG